MVYCSSLSYLCFNTFTKEDYLRWWGYASRTVIPDSIHKYLQQRLNGYVQKDEITTDAIKEDDVVSPGLGDNAGVCGALALAKMAKDRD